MNTNKLSWLLLLCLPLGSCNRVVDEQPTPSETVPPAAVQALKTQFPQAEGMLFKTIEANRIWQVDFSQRNSRYTAATTPQMVLTAYQQAAQALPDSLTSTVKNTVIEGGTFSNLRVQQYDWFKSSTDNGQRMLADYDWKGTRYTFRWSVTRISGKTTYVTELLPYNRMDYRTDNVADMPAAIQQALTSQGAQFSYALVSVDQTGQKLYDVSIQKNGNYYAMIYDEEGQIQWVSMGDLTATFQLITHLAQPIQTYLQQTPELAGFTVSGQFSRLSYQKYNNVETVLVNLQKGRQTWFMTFDGKGKLLKRTYLNLV